eukprot:1088393-Rhodomonas_salina.1
MQESPTRSPGLGASSEQSSPSRSGSAPRERARAWPRDQADPRDRSRAWPRDQASSEPARAGGGFVKWRVRKPAVSAEAEAEGGST